MEMIVKYLCEEILADEVANTKTYVEKKLSQSYTEIEAERISEEQALQNPEEESEEEGEEEEKPIYNPKNIPLGWLVSLLFKKTLVKYSLGMVNQFHIGCTNCMVLIWNMLAKYVEMRRTEVRELLRDILRKRSISKVYVFWVFSIAGIFIW